MTLKDVKTPEIKIKFNEEEWRVKFELRNFAVLKERFNISENDLLQGLIKGDIGRIPYAIWTSTLVFAPFDELNPLKIEKEIPLEDLFKLDLGDLKRITDEVIKAMEAFLPKQPEGGAAKKPTAAKKKKSLK